ncbi:metallophosphoesterase family protein, partial [Thermodesulfobacteriota bacterium]
MKKGPDRGRAALLLSTFCMAFVAAMTSPLEAVIELDVHEVLGEITDSSASIFVQLGQGIESSFSFKAGYDVLPHGPDHDYPFETSVQTGLDDDQRLDFLLDGLTANMTYYYSLAGRESEEEEWVWRPERRFVTPRSAGAPFRFCVITDLHYHPITPLKQQVCRNLEADTPDFVVTIGDMVPAANQAGGEPIDCEIAYNPFPDGIHSQEDADYHYKRFMYFLMNFFSHSSMIVWINGNHEGLAGFQSTCPQYNYLLNARRKYLPLLAHDEPNAFYGDLVWGDVHIIWLDPLAFAGYDPLMWNDPTGYVLGDVQKDWLTATLTASTARWKLIFAHTLFGGAGPSFECSPGNAYARGNANFVDNPGTDQILIQSLMEQYGVDAYIYGHDHMYSISEYNNVKYILAGGGITPDWQDCLYRYYLPWTVIDEIGHLRFDVEPDRLMLSYIKTALDENNGEV